MKTGKAKNVLLINHIQIIILEIMHLEYIKLLHQLSPQSDIRAVVEIEQ